MAFRSLWNGFGFQEADQGRAEVILNYGQMDRYHTYRLFEPLFMHVDKLYITQTEWSNWFGGARAKKEDTQYKRLPFNCCALSLKPYSDPVCTPDGTIFDLINIVPYLRRHGKNPVTGQDLDVKNLIKLNMKKDGDGQWLCPITLKHLHDNLYIVANKKTGNVYAKEAIDQLKDWTDFVTGEPFTKDDLIVLQNPDDMEKGNIIKFDHLKELFEPEKKTEPAKTGSFEDTSVLRSKGKVAASLTSTFMTPVTTNEYNRLDEEGLMFKSIKQNGRAIMRTNFGDLTIDLECVKAPKTCYNFIQLSKKGYYQGIKFHRLVPGFVIQGGDPTGDGTGGESIWGKPFDNEFHQSLSHDARGVLSMANKGKPFTNTSQFFITFAPKKHLDKIHPIFGRLIAGFDVLDRIERLPHKDSVPLEDIVIEDVVVMLDPFEEYRKEQAASSGLAEKKRRAMAIDPTLAVKRAKASANTPLTIGRYLKKPQP